MYLLRWPLRLRSRRWTHKTKSRRSTQKSQSQTRIWWVSLVAWHKWAQRLQWLATRRQAWLDRTSLCWHCRQWSQETRRALLGQSTSCRTRTEAVRWFRSWFDPSWPRNHCHRSSSSMLESLNRPIALRIGSTIFKDFEQNRKSGKCENDLNDELRAHVGQVLWNIWSIWLFLFDYGSPITVALFDFFFEVVRDHARIAHHSHLSQACQAEHSVLVLNVLFWIDSVWNARSVEVLQKRLVNHLCSAKTSWIL